MVVRRISAKGRGGGLGALTNALPSTSHLLNAQWS